MKKPNLHFDVEVDGVLYPLVRDPAHVHPDAVHTHLSTDTVTEMPREQVLRRMLGVYETMAEWYDDEGRYKGRDPFGIGVQGEKEPT